MTTPVEHIRVWQDGFTKVRRDLHAHPELGFEEHRTARVVCEQLKALGIEHHSGVGRTGPACMTSTTRSFRSVPATWRRSPSMRCR